MRLCFCSRLKMAVRREMLRVENRYYKSLDSDQLPLWPSGLSFWLQIQRPVLGSRRYPTFGEVVGLERGPLSLVSTIEELLERKSSGSGLESREYGRRDHSP
jgi:hypothetical protein